MKRAAFALALMLTGCAPKKPDSPAPPPAPATDWESASKEALELLKALIRIDTINPPQKGSPKKNADETALCRTVQRLLADDGIGAEVIESEPGRGNLIARIKGSDPSKKALLMMAHVDVVNVDPVKWKHDPLAAVEEGGYLWGRGTLDDKGPAAVSIQAMRLVARRKLALKRDLVLMLNADEESSGRYGAEFMVKNHWAKLDPAFVINEGGRIIVKGGAVDTYSIQSGEKIYNDVRIWVRGESGHSSEPRANNSVYALARILSKLQSHQAPVRINPTVAKHLGALATREKDGAAAALMRAAAAGDVKAGEELAAKDPKYNAMLRSTFVPTLVEGGIRENVLPPDASVNVNIRLLPGEKLNDMIETLARVANLPRYALIEASEIDDWRKPLGEWLAAQEKLQREGAKEGVYEACVVVADRGIDAPASPLDGELHRAMEKVGREMWPSALVLPMMGRGATDSRFFRARGVPAYGMLPLPATDEDLKGFHDHNERVAVSSVGAGVRYMVRIIEEVCR